MGESDLCRRVTYRVGQEPVWVCKTGRNYIIRWVQSNNLIYCPGCGTDLATVPRPGAKGGA